MESSTRSVKLSIQESDILKLILEFLEKRDFAFSQIALERESGVVNGSFNEDILFFRQLILQGHVICPDFVFNFRFFSCHSNIRISVIWLFLLLVG